MEKIHIMSLVFLVIIFTSEQAQSKAFLINCGTNTTVTVDGRKWVGDLETITNLTLAASSSQSAATPDSSLASLYKSARIFTDVLNYTFQGIQGDCFLRLHFCPFPFQNFNVNHSSFTVIANALNLLSNFNVPAEIFHKNNYSNTNSTYSSLVREYILFNLDVLLLHFIPSKGSFGFINAIEIVPLPDRIFADSVNRVGGNEVNLNLTGRGIETMYRLNVGGPQIKSSRDSDFWRMWEVDSSYMITENAGSEIRNGSNITYVSSNDSSVAPLLVYETARAMSNTEVLEKRFNMSWKFEVNPNFDYLIRLHFCELQYDKANQRIFRIYINNRSAADNFDVYVQAGGKNRAYHQDYFDPVSSKINTLWIQLGPDTAAGASGTDALLNGLEIFKLSRNGNLAYVELFDSAGNSVKKSNSTILWVGIVAGVASVLVIGVICAFLICFCRNRRKELSDTKDNATGWRPLFLHGSVLSSIGKAKGGVQSSYGSIMPGRVGKRFTLAEIRAATNNFDESFVIGIGGFGKVYRGEIEDGTLVAIKRANPQSEQGLAEFETEIEMLSKLRHRHLVSMIGFCEEQNEMILVYEYMGNGTLRSHLFGSDLPQLTWKQRLEACIGAARGLHYLHTGADHGIIHRDVKTTNILLDENFVAKMSDFGLSKTGPALDHTHVSTAVKGSFGYLDPEYFRRQQLTEKSDVYSFGVVLFEVVCARAVINPTLPKDQINLAEWALKLQQQGSLETIIDSHLKGNYCPKSMKKFGEIAEKCLGDEGKNRPTMGEVLWHLEYVLQLHEAWVRGSVTDSSLSMSQPPEDAEEKGKQALEEESDRSQSDG
ncbi:probable receptor-like protein kinase At1g30570 [Euphorbia lathyris]|uniref:probable receptor-like protein kinase At1g30570 n=1 Tax=Euphorbia lathyris TaxID=212925 RepID=UPI003313D9A5